MATLVETQSPTVVPNFISGARVENSGAARSLTVSSPIDGSIIGTLPLSSPEDLNAVVASAKEGFKQWSTTSIKNRAAVLYRFKQLVEENIEELAELVTRENGKTIGESKAGIAKGLEVVEYACSVPNIPFNNKMEVSRGVDCFTRQYPVGVVAGITPFNFPAMVPMWMFPIALICGNSFILKPSEQVPFTAVRLAELFKEAGLPDGVFNVIHGDREIVEGILDHPEIAAAAFVGSTPVAKAVYQRGTAAGKKTLALGGAKNHLIVVPDADPAITASNVTASVTGCAGQRCMAASVLILVGKDGESDHILDAINAEMQKVKAGENMGAIINPKSKERIESYITRAAENGAKILVDGRQAVVPGHENGNYVNPTVIDGVEPSHEAACDEIFGPVITVLRADTLDDALAIENANPFGNAAAIYTTSGATARYFESRASAGMLGINIGVPVPREPFSFGGWNDSKFGEGDITGADGVKFWTKTKKVTEKWTASASQNWMS